MEKAYTSNVEENFDHDEPELAGEIIALRPFEQSSFSMRTLACLIDQGIIFLPQCLLSTAIAILSFYALLDSSLEINFVRAVSAGTFMSSMLLVHWLYFSFCSSSKTKATPGMSLLGLKVQKEHGEKLNFFEASNRYWTWLFSSLFFGIILLGLLSNKKMMLHDQLNNSSVVIDN